MQDAANWGPPNLTFASGIQALTDANQSLTRNQSTSGSADLFWSRSPHNIHIGLDARRQQFNTLGQQDPRGAFAFTGAATGSDFADFLLGLPDTVALAYGNADKYFRSAMWDAYFTDDWRLSPGFTLNAGMRWEYGEPITEKYGRLVNLDVTPGFADVAPVVAASATGPLTGTHYPASLIDPYKRGFEPRIGFAWHPFLASSLVVRGGYGIYYDTSVYQSIATQMAQQAPLSRSLSMQGAGLDDGHGVRGGGHQHAGHVRHRSAFPAGIFAELAAFAAARHAGVAGDDGYLSRYQGHGRAAALSSQHVSDGRGEPMPTVPDGIHV